MWENVWEMAKRHSYIVVGSIIGLVIVIWFFWGRSSSGPGGAVAYPYQQDPNVVAANAQEAISQNQTNAAVAIAAGQNSTAISLAKIMSKGQTTQVDAALAAVRSNNAASVAGARIQSNTLADYFNNQLAAIENTNATSQAINAANVNLMNLDLAAREVSQNNMQNWLAGLASMGKGVPQNVTTMGGTVSGWKGFPNGGGSPQTAASTPIPTGTPFAIPPAPGAVYTAPGGVSVATNVGENPWLKVAMSLSGGQASNAYYAQWLHNLGWQ